MSTVSASAIFTLLAMTAVGAKIITTGRLAGGSVTLRSPAVATAGAPQLGSVSVMRIITVHFATSAAHIISGLTVGHTALRRIPVADTVNATALGSVYVIVVL